MDCFVFFWIWRGFGQWRKQMRDKKCKLWLLQKNLRGQRDHAETLWALIVFHNFLSDQSIHLKKGFFFLPNILITHMPTSIHCCRLIFNLAQRFLLSHCALPHQSAHTGGATNECSRGFTILKQMGDKIFLLIFLLKKLCFIIYILSLYYLNCSILSNVFLPSCPMYWWSVSSGYMLLNPTKKKCMTSCQEKSLLVCFGLVFQPLLWFCSCFHFGGPHIRMLWISAFHWWSYPCIVRFLCISFWFALLVCFSETYREGKKTCLFCVVMVMVMQVITVLLKWTSEPVKVFEGKITYIALTS